MRGWWILSEWWYGRRQSWSDILLLEPFLGWRYELHCHRLLAINPRLARPASVF